MVLIQLAPVDVPIRGHTVFICGDQAPKCCAVIHPSLESCQWQLRAKPLDQGRPHRRRAVTKHLAPTAELTIVYNIPLVSHTSDKDASVRSLYK